MLPDSRGAERHLRVTWHPATETVVFSHWTGPVCTASTPVHLADASRVIELLVGALRTSAGDSTADRQSDRIGTGALQRLLDRFRPDPASIRTSSRQLRDSWIRRANG